MHSEERLQGAPGGGRGHVRGGLLDLVDHRDDGDVLGEHRIDEQAALGQALALTAAQGGFVEVVFDEPGRYPLVNHVMIDAERGAHGVIEVTR